MDEFREVSAADVFQEVTSPDHWVSTTRDHWMRVREASERVQRDVNAFFTDQVYHPPAPLQVTLAGRVRDFADDIHAELDRWGWYDEVKDIDHDLRRSLARSDLKYEPPGPLRDELERHVRHADLLDKWPVIATDEDEG